MHFTFVFIFFIFEHKFSCVWSSHANREDETLNLNDKNISIATIFTENMFQLEVTNFRVEKKAKESSY